MAVGSDDSGTPFAASWNGVKWSVTNDGATGFGTLVGVSCLSPTWCISVGDYDNTRFVTPLIESWNGRAWTVDVSLIANLTLPKGSLDSVTCTSTTRCFAVGESNPNNPTPLIESWNGNKWSNQRLADSSAEPDANLTSVICTSEASCVAIGYFGNPGSTDPFMEFTGP